MIYEKIYKGKFKTPGNTEWYNGTLTFDPENGAKLELFGTFNNWLTDRDSKKIIIGETDQGSVTLVDNWYRKTTSSRNNIVIGTYQPNIIIDGHIFEEVENIKFDKTIFRVFNLFQWIAKTGQNRDDIDYYKLGKFSIHYSEIPEIDFNLNEKATGKLSFEAPIEFGEKQNELKIYEDAYVTFQYVEQKKLEHILSDITRFINSITLFTNEQSYATSILLQNENVKDDNLKIPKPKFMGCHYQNSFFDTKHKFRRRGEFLLDYQEIENEYAQIIQRWFNLYEEIDSVLNLLLKHYKDKYHFSPDNFMDTIRAVENFHRIDHNNERIPVAKFQMLVDQILTEVNLDKEDKEWLEGRLKGNEPSLKNRLKELIKENDLDLITQKVGKVNSFCWKVTTSRNYYTHYAKELKKDAATGSNLLELNRTLRALLISSILRKLEVPLSAYEYGLKYHLG